MRLDFGWKEPDAWRRFEATVLRAPRAGGALVLAKENGRWFRSSTIRRVSVAPGGGGLVVETRNSVYMGVQILSDDPLSERCPAVECVKT